MNDKDPTNQSTPFALDTWKRLVPTILFLMVFNVAEFLLYAVTLFQFLIKLFTGDTNRRLLEFANDLGVYLRQVVNYLTWVSDDLPYPFSPWPSMGPAEQREQSPAKPRGDDNDY
ncbi:MAG TPA: DUF4389 domain-containing protein [Gammaproteobacteria bacterium]|nr:DUF4389 domain-containing protein [Gammaproteobacteria bacterium]